MRLAILLPILAMLLLAAVWAALFVAPSVPGLQGPRWSVVLFVDESGRPPGAAFEEWAQRARRFARARQETKAVLRDAAIDADLAGIGYRVANDVEDPISWLDARMRDGEPFFLALHVGADTDIAFERIRTHLERTGLARRTILAAWTKTFFALDMPGSRAVPALERPSESADILPTLLRLIGLTPSHPLPGYALAG
jgi:hypothetical protein